MHSTGQAAKYGQKKKRQAIKQIQQSSKRLANSHRNPFSWNKSTDDSNESSVVEKPGNNKFKYVASSQGSVDASDSHNPFLLGPTTSSSSKDMAPKTIFTSDVTKESPFQTANIPVSAPFQNTKLEEIRESPFAPSSSQQPPQTTANRISSKRISRHLSSGNGKRNQSTKAHNSLQLQKCFEPNVRTSEVLQAKKITRKVGVCPYMCSQKEYRMRLDQGIYSFHETENGEFVHHLAVKEYARASADQEESQPEDLRPSMILLKTVQYLCINLVDKYPDSFEDLYGFIWNRTRAIRKDITQQRLCDIHTVSVLETITRFHIFSGYALSDSSGGFEQKYNNENLEKTLTSLRHIYTDLSLSTVSCQNEPEFRMYHILLNLNSGQVMRDVSNLPHHVLKSNYVSYALACYNAFNSKNFVRFFKLFKTGPLLACCVLYRYLNNVRQKGLISIINSHTTPVKQSSQSIDYPIAKLQTMMGCDSIDETVDFVKSMNVDVHDSNEFASLRSRQYSVNTDQMRGRLQSIDSKICQPLGKILCTGEIVPDSILGTPQVPSSPAPQVLKHVVSPFEQNPLIEPVLLKFSSSMIAHVSLNEVQDIVAECIQTLQFIEQSKIHIIKELLDEICQTGLREEITNIKNNDRKVVMNYTKDLYYHLVFPSLVNTALKSVIVETILEESGKKFIQDSSENLMDCVVREEMSSILVSDSAHLSKFEKDIERTSSIMCEELINSFIEDDLKICGLEAEAQLLAEKKALLKETLLQNVVQKRYYFKIWKKRYSKIYAKIHTLDNIPPRIVPSTSSEVLLTLLGNGKGKSDNMSRLALSSISHIDLTSPTKAMQKKIQVHKKLQLRLELLEEASSLKGIPLKCLSSIVKPVYLTLAMPDFTSKLSKFLLDSFGVSDISEKQDYIRKAVAMGKSVLYLQLVNVSLISMELFAQSCKASHAIVLLSVQKNELSHISHLRTPKLLIADHEPVNWEGLFIESPASMTNMRCCKLYKNLDSTLAKMLLTELRHPKFKMIDVRDTIQGIICLKLTDILLSKQFALNNTKVYDVDPNAIITFYNSIIRYISQAVCKEELKNIEWPSLFDDRKDICIDWNDSKKMASLSSEITSLELPAFTGNLDSPEDCMDYCSTLKTFSLHFLVSRISAIVEQVGVQWCLILNQVIHHIIEHAIFVDKYTVLLEAQLSELNSLNGEKAIENAFVFNGVDAELADYESNSMEFNEEDVAEMWQSLTFYESKISFSDSAKPVASEILQVESKQVDNMENDLQELTTSISETEARLMRIVDEGALPSYLVKSLINNNVLE